VPGAVRAVFARTAPAVFSAINAPPREYHKFVPIGLSPLVRKFVASTSEPFASETIWSGLICSDRRSGMKRKAVHSKRRLAMREIHGIVARMRFWSLLPAAAIFLLPGGVARAADESVKEKAVLCTPCHGDTGVSQTENIPSLAGQPDLFLQWQLVFFRSGSRKNEVMQQIAEQTNNEDIRNLGAYFASLAPPKASAPDDNPDLSMKGAQAAAGRRCASCHGDTFAGTKAVARLAGQREEYLLKALHDYKSNERVGGGVAAMAEVAYSLSDEEITALAHYLAHR
jgi:cytochrome c553